MPQSRKQEPEGQEPEGQEPEGRDNGIPRAEFSVPEGWATVLFDKAFQLNEQYTAMVAARKANRDSLRSLATQGLLSDDEREVLAELYPERDAHRRTDEERAAELEAQARKVRERAAQREAEKAAKSAETPAAA